MDINGKLDPRFSEATAPVGWQEVSDALANAELYWLTTVRGDGRPHVTPLVGVWVDDSFVFCTGGDEQKARNLERNANVAVTTGANSWKDGMDVVVEGAVQRLTGTQALTPLADTYREKYNGEWDFTATDEEFVHPDGGVAHVFRVTPTKVIAFAKSPHGQTTFRP
jgi:nitroimidazol reductase NimA-like FMN-containing flavoprotein (pyridoxamine 5'-phosphate oxidase superfamily)